jgi:hypothetical protein
MNKKLLKLLSIGILTLQLSQSPSQAKLFNADTTMPDATLPTTLCTAAVLYTGYNYLIRQDFLVEKKYPSAFAWYQSMQAKYPGLLDGIYFIQRPAGSLIPDFLSKKVQLLNKIRI